MTHGTSLRRQRRAAKRALAHAPPPSAIAEVPRPRKEGPRVWCAIGHDPYEVRGPHTHRECRRIAYRWWLEGRLGCYLERRASDGKDVYTMVPHFAGPSRLRLEFRSKRA